MYVYRLTERNPHLYTVGFYAPDGTWHIESDHGSEKEAAERVTQLNGGNNKMPEGQEIARSQSSVEISTNGKGEKSWKVKAYADDIETAIKLAVDADKTVAAELKGGK